MLEKLKDMKTNRKTTSNTGYTNNNTHSQGYRATYGGGYSVTYEDGKTASSYALSELTGLEKEARREQAKEREREALMNYRAMKQAFRDMKTA